MVIFQLFAVCLICCILLTAKVDCRQLDSYLHDSETRYVYNIYTVRRLKKGFKRFFDCYISS